MAQQEVIMIPCRLAMLVGNEFSGAGPHREAPFPGRWIRGEVCEWTEMGWGPRKFIFMLVSPSLLLTQALGHRGCPPTVISFYSQPQHAMLVSAHIDAKATLIWSYVNPVL